jgi:methylmalonyl-CoA/ethylmalonyl-CoA epimerase
MLAVFLGDPELITTAPDGSLGLQFHHVGVACADIDKETRQFAVLGYCTEGDDFEDPIQGIRGRFLGGPAPRLELLMNIEGSTVLSPWLAANVKLYHLAYETHDMTRTIEQLAKLGAKVVRAPVPAVAFQGRRIAFLMLPNRLLVELIEGS